MKENYLQKGDVVLIQLTDRYFVVGQCMEIYQKHSNLMFFYKTKLRKESDYDENKSSILDISNLAIYCITFDSHVESGEWKIVDNRQSNIDSKYFPCFKLGSGPNDYYVESFDANYEGKGIPSRFDDYSFRSFISPNKAIEFQKMYFNLMEKSNDYDSHTAKHLSQIYDQSTFG